MSKNFMRKLGLKERIKSKLTYQKPTIFVGVVEQSFPMQRWARLSLHHLMVEMARDGFPLMEPYSPTPSDNIAVTRNDIVKAFLNSGADLLLMMDNDIVFPMESFKLLWTHDQDVNAAITVRTMPPHYPKVGKIVKSDQGMMIKQVLEFDHTMAFRLGISGIADCIAMDFALFKRHVFEVLPNPWFYSPKTEAEGGAVLSDSWIFCLNAVNAGLSVMADPIVGSHVFKIGLYPFSLRDYQLYREKGWAESVDAIPDDKNDMENFRNKFRGVRIQDGVDVKEVNQPTTTSSE
jgi:hypothetical protein